MASQTLSTSDALCSMTWRCKDHMVSLLTKGTIPKCTGSVYNVCVKIAVFFEEIQRLSDAYCEKKFTPFSSGKKPTAAWAGN
jgi:hypothetical protein